MLLFKRGLPCAFVCIFYFSQLIDVLEAVKCPPGKRVKEEGCEDCPKDQFHPGDNISQQCKRCTKCQMGSEVVSRCSSKEDTKCRCRSGYNPRFPDSTVCKCDPGSGLKTTGGIPECLECEDGYFSKDDNTYCVKWRECNSGVKFIGNKTADAICNDEGEQPQVQPTSRQYTRRRSTPQTDSPDLPKHTTTATPLELAGTHMPNIVLMLLGFGFITLLVVTILSCKMFIKPCMKTYKQPMANAKPGSLCRSPVEESGDKESDDNSDSTLIKLDV